MAPRARTKKRANLRIDAALDAMNPLGFPPKLVRDTVKELLSVYGGDEGWVFIEEACYILLINTLVEKQNDGAIEMVDEENGRGKDHLETSVAGCSRSVIDEASSSNPRAEITMKQNDDALISSYVDNEALRITATLPANDSEENDDIVSGDAGHFRSSYNESSPARARARAPALAPAHIPKIKRRKSYHGWISSDEYNKEDLVYLTPAPLPEELARLFKTSHAHGKRKKRWDVKPGEEES